MRANSQSRAWYHTYMNESAEITDRDERRRRFLTAHRKRVERMLRDMPPDQYITRKSMQARLRQIKRELSLIDPSEA